MQFQSIIFIASLLAGSALAVPAPVPASNAPSAIFARTLSECQECMTKEIKEKIPTFVWGTTKITKTNVADWSAAGTNCQLEGKCASAPKRPVYDSSSDSDKAGKGKQDTHKAPVAKSEIQQLREAGEKAGWFFKNDAGASSGSN